VFALRVDDEVSLRLLTFDAAGSRSKVVVLEIPSSLVLDDAVSVTLDSYLGLVFLVMVSGEIISIPYA